MKNRRYFTCPIQAIYMSKEFGVIYIVGDQAHYSYKDFLEHTFNHLNRRDKFYVAEVSEEIFEPKKGDIGHKITLCDSGFEFGKYDGKSWYCKRGYNKNLKIIMRDNKHFFIGELENEIQH